MNKFWFAFAGDQVRSIGKTLRRLDIDEKGEDDVIGTLMDSGGRALVAFGTGNVNDFKSYLKLAADGIYSYLGLPVPGEEE
jgi:hypothetical protein